MTGNFKAKLYLLAGWISVVLGIIGIPTPLLPTTPFLLLAAFCFARGSQRWHDWLVNHHTLGAYITAFRDQKGLTVKQKWRVAASIICSLAVTGWFAPRFEGRLGVIVIGAFWLTWLYRYRTAPDPPPAKNQPTSTASSLDCLPDCLNDGKSKISN